MLFVLVHGSWHDGAAWRATAECLEQAGHVAHWPTLAGHGHDVDRNVSHDDCVASLAAYISDNALSDFVLVGHSFGGSVISRLAPLMAERIRRLVYWNAFVPRHGVALLDEAPPDFADALRALAAASPDNSVPMPYAVWRASFMTDVDDETAWEWHATLSPEPFKPMSEPLDMTGFDELDVPRSYLFATDDRAVPWHPVMSSRLGQFRLVEMPGDHEALLTRPRQLAQHLILAGED
jgi:pimeloyl-ACP methyl ester carboxylesterase